MALELLDALLATLPAAVIGLLGGALLGTVLTVAGERVGESQTDALVSIGLAGPVIGLLPLFAVLIGNQLVLEVLVATSAATLPIYLAATQARATRHAGRESVLLVLGSDASSVAAFRLAGEQALASGAPGLVIAAPAAALGAVAGQFAGADSGLGILLVSAMARSDGGLVAAATLATIALGLALAALAQLYSRNLTSPADLLEPLARAQRPSGRAQAVRSVAVAGVLLLGWALVTRTELGSSYVWRSPFEVVQAFMSAPASSLYADRLGSSFATTLVHAGIMLGAGISAALILTVAAWSSGYVRRGLAAVATAGRALPLVVFAPIVVSLLGHGDAFVAATGVLAVGLPTAAVAAAHAMRTSAAADWMLAQGAPGRRRLLVLAVPLAVLSVALSLPLATVSAVYGAVTAEWLATGDGLGYLVPAAISASDFDTVWVAAVSVLGLAAAAHLAGAAAAELVAESLAPRAILSR